MTKTSHPRPLGITALIILFVTGTLVSFLAGWSLLFPSPVFNVMWRLNPHGHEGLLRMGLWAVMLLFAASLFCGTTAVGLWKRARWGHILAIILIGINLVSDIVNTVLGIEPRTIVGVPIALAILLCLMSRRVRKYFAKDNSARMRGDEVQSH
jgi:hypothetical protein